MEWPSGKLNATSKSLCQEPLTNYLQVGQRFEWLTGLVASRANSLKKKKIKKFERLGKLKQTNRRV